jgi:hypothetical protein
MVRSSHPHVRNPILALESARRLRILLNQNPAVKAEMIALLRELRAVCRTQDANAYRRRKGPMTSYWMASGTYVGHIAHALNRKEG